MHKPGSLQFQPHQRADVTVLSEEGRCLGGAIEDVAGRRVLMVLDEVVPLGAALRVEWNNYIVLAEVQSLIDWQDRKAFVVEVEHLIRQNTGEEPSSERIKPAPDQSADQSVAMRRLLFGIRVAALNFDQSRYDAFQTSMNSLERRLDRDPSGANCLKISEEAVKALAAHRKHTLASVSSHLTDIRLVTAAFVQTMAALEASQPQLAGGSRSMGESLFDLEMRFSKLLDKFA